MKKENLNNMRFATLLIVSILISGCEQKTSEPASEIAAADTAILGKEIESRLREFENHLQNGDSIALGNMYTADAVIMPSLVGRENIVKNFGGMIRQGITGSSFNTTDLWGDEQLVVEEGTGIWSNENGEIVGRGKYLVVWKKEDGAWKILRDSWYPEKR